MEARDVIRGELCLCKPDCRHCDDQAAAILSALEQSDEATRLDLIRKLMPEGLAVVPREPTKEMVTVGTEARWRSAVRDANSVREIYRAMLAAAPGRT